MSATIEKESKKSSGRGGRRPGAGRPKGGASTQKLEIAAMAKGHADQALKTLVAVAKKSRSDAARVMAVKVLLEYGFGRPRQSVEVTGAEGGPVAIAVTRRVVDPSARP